MESGRDCPAVCPIYNMAPLLDRFWPPRRNRRSRAVDRERQLARLPEFKEAADNVRHKHANASHPLALLRARRERPRRRAAEKRDELAPLHSITSSARASSIGGTSRPSALAVLRLMTVRTSLALAQADRLASRLSGCGRRNSPRAYIDRRNQARRRSGRHR